MDGDVNASPKKKNGRTRVKSACGFAMTSKPIPCLRKGSSLAPGQTTMIW